MSSSPFFDSTRGLRMNDLAQPPVKKAGPGWVGAGVGAAFYVLTTWIYIAHRAWDLDGVFFFQALLVMPVALLIGAVSGSLVASMFSYLRARRFRLNFSSLLACALALGVFLYLCSKVTPGEVTRYGEARFYGWPVPTLCFNYEEVIQHEVEPTEHTYYPWGFWGPGLVLDLTALLLGLGGIAVGLEQLADWRGRGRKASAAEEG